MHNACSNDSRIISQPVGVDDTIKKPKRFTSCVYVMLRKLSTDLSPTPKKTCERLPDRTLLYLQNCLRQIRGGEAVGPLSQRRWKCSH